MSLADSMNKSQSEIWGAQSPYLKQLYGQAQKLFGQQSGQVGDAAERESAQAGRLMDKSASALSDLAKTGGMQAGFANPNNELAQQQLASMSEAIGQNFQRSVIPGIKTAAGLSGGMGGSREALMKGQAAGDASRSIADAAQSLYGQQYGIAAQSAAGADSTRMAAAGALPGVGAASYEMAMSPYSAAWSPIASLAQSIGGPQVLQSSQGYSRAQSASENWNKSHQQGSGSSFGFSLF